MTYEEKLQDIFDKRFCLCGVEVYEDHTGNLWHRGEHPGCARVEFGGDDVQQ